MKERIEVRGQAAAQGPAGDDLSPEEIARSLSRVQGILDQRAMGAKDADALVEEMLRGRNGGTENVGIVAPDNSAPFTE